jgi:hypothetical protein
VDKAYSKIRNGFNGLLVRANTIAGEKKTVKTVPSSAKLQYHRAKAPV